MSARGRHSADAALVAALAAGSTCADAAATAHVSERTVRRRLGEDEVFRAELARARQELVDRAIGRAADALVEAVESLRATMASAESESARVTAARALIQFARHSHADGVAEAVRVAASITTRDVSHVIGRVMDEAFALIPDEHHERFLERVRMVGTGR